VKNKSISTEKINHNISLKIKFEMEVNEAQRQRIDDLLFAVT
jgi:hypothetical protein